MTAGLYVLRRVTIASLCLAGWLYPCFAAEQIDNDLSREGWRLWPDTAAKWDSDSIYLPDEVDLAKMPVNPPTGGWDALNDQQGIPVMLPSTVEEHYWDKLQKKKFTSLDYEGHKKTTENEMNGSYIGVSWWWRQFNAPSVPDGQRLLIHFRGARLRAEVYVNGKLCGYTIMDGLPFQADITSAVKPGAVNQLAVRITNPGGRLGWADIAYNWGQYKIPSSRGFGGLDDHIVLETRAPVAITDLAVLNQPDPHKVTLLAEVENVSDRDINDQLDFSILDTKASVWTCKAKVSIAAGQTTQVRVEAHVPNAILWDLQSPRLYKAEVFLSSSPKTKNQRDFGFRWFNAEGIDEDALFRLNGKRIVLRSAIEWGYWAPNGYWAVPEQLQRSMDSAKALGLNCIQGHRHQTRPGVLDAQDRAGILRQWEPGGGRVIWEEKDPKGLKQNFKVSPKGPVDTSGLGGEPRSFTERYMAARILQGVKRDRSHPALIIYNLQNESAIWCDNPNIYWIFRKIHELDPSRIITLHSGAKYANQAFMLPYSEEIRHDDGTGYAGWTDTHRVGTPGVYVDGLYRGPDAYWYWSDNRKEIVAWGEMGTSGSPDDHQRIVEWYRDNNRDGYDRAAHERILNSYNAFLDKYGFRNEFPTASTLFRQVGDKHYFIASKLMEQCRFNDVVDYIVLSGYESTTIDDHCGLLDMHRFPKGNPAILHASAESNLLAIRPRNVVVKKGDQIITDIHLVNETGRGGAGQLTVTATNVSGKQVFTREYPVQLVGGDRYGQLLQEAISIPATDEGYLAITGTLSFEGKSFVEKTERVYVVNLDSAKPSGRVAVLENGSLVKEAIRRDSGVTSIAYAPGVPCDALVLSPDSGEGAWASQLDAILKQIHDDGMRFVIWPDKMEPVRDVLRALDKRGVMKLNGFVGACNEPWFGAWQFSKKNHPLLAGLPSGRVMDWEYQVSIHMNFGKANEFDGVLMDAPGMESVVGYGRDHQVAVGSSVVRIPYGKGEIIVYMFPSMVRSLTDEGTDLLKRAARGGGPYFDGNGVHPVIARRLLMNALH